MIRSFAETYQTRACIQVSRQIEEVDGAKEIDVLVGQLDARRGMVCASTYEVPGRYTRWDVGFCDPPIEIGASGRELWITVLNARGHLLLPAFEDALLASRVVCDLYRCGDTLRCRVVQPSGAATEEERTRRPSVFSVLRAICAQFHAPEDAYLGLYGAFGYDLAFQFDPIALRMARPEGHRDLVLYFPDELVVVDHASVSAVRVRYDFTVQGRSTASMARGGTRQPFEPGSRVERECDHEPGEYQAVVELAREAFVRGDLFEVVPGQTFARACRSAPSTLFRRLRKDNPSPYGFIMNLGEREYLVGASPEMFVRVNGQRVETCPISGTIRRGENALGDARQILALLNSKKEASELTMCTDVDRNDKFRICRPDTVQVIGRRQIELYSKLIHTVDHVEGYLRPGFDALDAFVTHAWSVTVTGAPKNWAMQFIEDHERSVRAWYGGAVGKIGFNGSLNTGLTLRTVRIRDGIAHVRAGATLLFDSVPDAEEQETRLKASALLEAIEPPVKPEYTPRKRGRRKRDVLRALLVDHEDSFVHSLAGYLRHAGAEVTTVRHGFDPVLLDELAVNMLVMSPGPGSPSDFETSKILGAAIERELCVFGVCLGLQALIEHFGGRLGRLSRPVHGKPSTIIADPDSVIFAGLPRHLTVGRYHSLFAAEVPACFRVTAEVQEDHVPMAIEHRDLPIAAVQFHPESIMSSEHDLGLSMIRNVVAQLPGRRARSSLSIGA